MLNRIRDRFGTAGLVVSIMALVLALAGGAFAASGGLNAKQKKQVKAIAKSFQGTGPAGAAGPAGPAGAKGDKGDKGDTGNAGTSVTNTVEGKGANCREGGSKFVGTSTTFACNGSPWTAGGTLPTNATETGTWAVNGTTADAYNVMATLSFEIPLAVVLDSTKVHYVSGAAPADCNDGVDPAPSGTNPEADSGHLCVFETGNVDATFAAISQLDGGTVGANRVGALVIFGMAANPGIAFGSWAVTG